MATTRNLPVRRRSFDNLNVEALRGIRADGLEAIAIIVIKIRNDTDGIVASHLAAPQR